MSEVLYRGVVLGEPKAQSRHRHFKMPGTDHVSTYDPSVKAKDSFISIIHHDAPKEPWSVPICMELNFYMGRPKGHYGSGKNASVLKASAPEWHTGKPDIDNLAKLVQDAMNKVFYRDDSLICQIVCRKLYSERPRTEIIVKSLL